MLILLDQFGDTRIYRYSSGQPRREWLSRFETILIRFYRIRL